MLPTPNTSMFATSIRSPVRGAVLFARRRAGAFSASKCSRCTYVALALFAENDILSYDAQSDAGISPAVCNFGRFDTLRWPFSPITAFLWALVVRRAVWCR